MINIWKVTNRGILFCFVVLLVTVLSITSVHAYSYTNDERMALSVDKTSITLNNKSVKLQTEPTVITTTGDSISVGDIVLNLHNYRLNDASSYPLEIQTSTTDNQNWKSFYSHNIANARSLFGSGDYYQLTIPIDSTIDIANATNLYIRATLGKGPNPVSQTSYWHITINRNTSDNNNNNNNSNTKAKTNTNDNDKAGEKAVNPQTADNASNYDLFFPMAFAVMAFLTLIVLLNVKRKIN